MDCRVAAFALILGSVGPGCTPSRSPWPVDCPPAAPANAEPIRNAKIESLAGQYDLVLVPLSYGPRSSSWRGRLELTLTDTLRRYYIHTIGGYQRRGMRPLAGHFRAANDPVSRMEDAEVEAGILYIGCRMCMDASPDELRLLAATPKVVWGLWYNPQSGFEIVMDSLGNPLPNPAGHFCMRRVDS